MNLTRNERTRKREADIIDAGGRKLSPTMLNPAAAKALGKLRKRYPSDTAAINAALIETAKRKAPPATPEDRRDGERSGGEHEWGHAAIDAAREG